MLVFYFHVYISRRRRGKAHNGHDDSAGLLVAMFVHVSEMEKGEKCRMKVRGQVVGWRPSCGLAQCEEKFFPSQTLWRDCMLL